MPTKKCITVYKFDELSDEAKEKAREWWREGGLDYEWYDCVESDFKEIGKILGIDVTKIFFTGFSSQGDGACFEGYYEYAKGSVKKLKEYAPQDTELHRIAEELAKAQKRFFYGIDAVISHEGHYYHEMCTKILVRHSNGEYIDNETDEIFTELLRDLMKWLYRTLAREYDYLNSDEQVDETIMANEYEFTEDGNRSVVT